jgi:uracil-DNA glycosylase family 4
MPATDDEIKEKYLERAIRELNQLSHELQACPHCPRGKLMPVLGSGHPQADVFMLKHAPASAEIEEGVAFYGRAGNALMKSFKRLGIDPIVVYGTLCVKCPIPEPDLAAPECMRRVVEEIAIVQPKIVVVMGEPALRVLNNLQVPLSRPIEPSPPPSTPSTPPTSTTPSTKKTPSRGFGGASRCWGSGTRTCPLTEQPGRSDRGFA